MDLRILFFSIHRKREQLQSVDPGLIYRQSPVKMRPGDATRGAYQPQDFSFFHHVAHRNIHRFQVSVKSVDAQPVIDNHGIAGEK